MTTDAELLHASQWLRDNAQRDEDVRYALHAAYRKYDAANISQLARSHPKVVHELYAGLSSMMEDVEAMKRHDEAVREALAKNRGGRAGQADDRPVPGG